MNRLVIIGNGFDLAHGLPTSYKDFIDDVWRQIALDENNFKDLVYVERKYGFLVNRKVESYSQYLDSLEDYKVLTKNDYEDANWDNDGFYVSKFGVSNRDYLLKFVNIFFKTICTNNHINNWVDIENEYYKILKEIVNSTSINFRLKKEKLLVLNDEFEQIKKLLESFLSSRVVNGYDFNEYADSRGSNFEFLNLFKPLTYRDNSEEMQLFLDEFPKSNQENLKNQFIYRGDELVADCKITFLNFNYTPTLLKYSRVLSEWKIPNDIIHIHGTLNNNNNRLNFGFGDEMDNDYKKIENIDDNEYLKNFKSFQYLHTSNYKHLLDLIDSYNFQLYIMGHSCGLSDRTMLNTIFEHPNCISIKVFYHQKPDGLDNYTEIIQNISRHFNKKALMREKIVNKTLCQPLPQIQLPRK